MKLIQTALILALLSACHPAWSQSPDSLLQQVMGKYAGIGSYSHKASATTLREANGQKSTTGMELDLHFQRPNRYFLRLQGQSVGGSIQIGCDGREEVVYVSAKNQYQKSKAPSAETEILKQFAKLGVRSEVDPLALLCKGLPRANLSGLKLAADETVNGIACSVLRSAYRPKGATTIGALTYWIDKRTGFIVKLKVEAKGLPFAYARRVMKGGKPTVERVNTKLDSSTTIRFSDIKAEAGTDFKVTIPPGAIEYKVSDLLGKPK